MPININSVPKQPKPKIEIGNSTIQPSLYVCISGLDGLISQQHFCFAN